MKQQALWTGLGLIGALRARISGGLPRDVTGVSIDTRTLAPGDLFFAIKGEARDGHDFVRMAFERGAAGAVIDDAHAGAFRDLSPLYVVRDVQESLEFLGARARERSPAYIAAITGSVGKTSTKDMAKTVFSRFGETHASAASYNNQWGVPLSLSRMPASARYGLFEIGMNHAGEIASLVRFVEPHVAVVTRVAPVHLEHFDSLEAIAAAKAEVFSGLVEGGVAIINRDDETYETLLEGAAASRAAHVFSFGESEAAQARLLSYDGESQVAEAEIFGRRLRYRIGAPGKHFAVNSLAVLTIAHVFGIDLAEAAEMLADFAPPKGRGRRETLAIGGGALTLIDESYNANPTSMRAAFDLIGAEKSARRRIAVLGDMLELGPSAGELHAGLAKDLEAAGVDLLFTAGPLMARLFYAAPESMRGAHRANAAELEEAVLSALAPGDVVMIKGSNGSRMARIVEAIRTKFPAETEAAS
ncbi:UDP-N-acetylmuramoylalanyl-D-glutamyl-2, 6-diaminopimelate--D-alanyl-D-alanine ligase [Methylosinus sp. R-45379]|uniref:UDP-N-acetylmuramoylalanyl-D-glutamyl-2, 6-diaminopimelate--D-alanyl-D-alanine ligase n=1 Tax=Methylosinus sp. R-45379 TaxID=980563 RepID=UPI0007C9617D|nr:UDP-N-acetylmuramoylalanyl-D-glutamyl-2,6-diaminopimelate--D-alanyl-D-alanine ligase [Methylosinus sp. R-45379]OAI27589.1 UDP-N-acetylmuramoylalanyl-D-glutamyl-2, 6-diaminopimelate--D-alanyl-D-alanine ligase [Methylosinus sp. R-45379]